MAAAGGGSYQRTRVRITADHVAKARSLIRRGKVEGRGIEWGDVACVGLTLRVTPQAGTWLLRMRASTTRLGTIETLDVDEARTAATRARLDLKDGIDPRRDLKIYEEAIVRGGSAEVAADVAWPEYPAMESLDDRRRRGPWQWDDLVDLFLAEKASELEPGYLRKYAAYLRHPAFGHIRHTLVRDVTAETLQGIRDDIISRNSLSAAARAVRQSREMLDWAWANHSGRSGMSKADEKWPLWKDQWAVKYKPGKRKHRPTIQELARTLALAERHRTLGQTEHATAPGTLGALWFVVLTGQRTGPLVETRHADVEAIDIDAGVPGPGWRAVRWSEFAMKEDRPFVLPVPPGAWEVLGRVLADKRRTSPSPWLFPSIRGDGHVSRGSLNQLLYRLQGRKLAGATSRRPLTDLLAQHGIRAWTLHDVRRSITTFLSDHRLGGAGSAILDHEAGVDEDERERRSQVTRLHYDQSQRIALKSEGMAFWVAAVLDAYRIESAALASLPAPSPRARTKRRAPHARVRAAA